MLAIALGIFFILKLVVIAKADVWPNAVQVTYMLVLLIIGTACFGKWLAYSVSETSEFDQDVTLKNETLNDTKLILVMSRHTILMKDNVIYVVPTADIVQFKTAGKR